jgi:hypothetical protein
MPAAKRSPRLKQLLQQGRRTSDQAQRAYLRAEQQLTEIEQREARERARAER